MKRLTQAEAIIRLTAPDVKIGSHVRVRYVAGAPAKDRAIDEAETAKERGLDLHVYTGSLEQVGLNKRGQFYFTLFAVDRDTVTPDGAKRRGAFRTFNPSKGELLALRVIR